MSKPSEIQHAVLTAMIKLGGTGLVGHQVEEASQRIGKPISATVNTWLALRGKEWIVMRTDTEDRRPRYTITDAGRAAAAAGPRATPLNLTEKRALALARVDQGRVSVRRLGRSGNLGYFVHNHQTGDHVRVPGTDMSWLAQNGMAADVGGWMLVTDRGAQALDRWKARTARN